MPADANLTGMGYLSSGAFNKRLFVLEMVCRQNLLPMVQ
jgi:hypothetical protein